MTRRLRIEDLAALNTPGQPRLSSDGTHVVYALRGVDEVADRSTSSLWLCGTGIEPRRLTRGPDDTAPVFAPGGETIAFLREGQLWTLPVSGGEAEQRTRMPIAAGEAVFSPDGGSIAFSAPVDPAAAEDETDDDRAARSLAPIVADGIDYQSDGSGFLRGVRRQLHLLDLATDRVRRLTGLGSSASIPSWSPDGTRLAFVARPAGADGLPWRSAVYTIEADAPAGPPRLVAFAEGTASTVSFAPDGSLVVVGWRGEPRGLARLYRVEPDGRVAELAAALDRGIMPGGPGYPGGLPQFSASGEVVFAARDRGCSRLYAVPLSGGEPRLLLGGEGRVVSGFSVTGDAVAVAVTDPASLGEIVLLESASGEETTLTRQGGAPEEVELFLRESREFAISDGVSVEGWLLRDPDRDPDSGPAPLLVDVHGGPHNAWNGAFDDMHLYHQELVARGWIVLMLNPRGSDGYGEEFYTAVDGAWGRVDAKDFLEPIDALVAEGLADPNRLAVTGYSYGGFMTCYLTSREPGRFRAAVAGGAVTDLTSMGGTSDDAHLLNVIEIGAMPWRGTDRERLMAMSPFTQVEKVVTPTLLLHGGEDVRCPVGQAEQWHYALRERGVPARLVLYPGGSHMFPLVGRPSHRIDYNRRVADWVEQYAGEGMTA